ncbi:MAG: hypothetical protein R2838_25830 [Caldilineaceae bacterium]
MSEFIRFLWPLLLLTLLSVPLLAWLYVRTWRRAGRPRWISAPSACSERAGRPWDAAVMCRPRSIWPGWPCSAWPRPAPR